MTEDNNMQQKVSAQTEQSIPDAEVSVNNTSTGQSPEQVQQFAKQIAELLQPQLTEAQRQEEENRRREAEKQKLAEEERQRREASKEAAAKEAALKARKKKRLLRGFRNLLIRTLLLIAVVYILFYQIIGVMNMPNDDMYPRIDSGDLLVFYRLDKDVRAQDIIVLQREAISLQEYDAEQAEEQAAQMNEDGEINTSVSAVSNEQKVPDIPPAQAVEGEGLKEKFFHLLYNASVKLGLRGKAGTQTFVCRVVATAGDTVEITENGSLIINGNSMIESNIFSPTTMYVGFTEYPLTLKAGECFVLADHRNGGADSRFFGPVKQEEILGTVITIARRNNL